MKSTMLATALALAALLCACGGTDDNEPEQRCQSAAPVPECYDKLPSTPLRAEAQ